MATTAKTKTPKTKDEMIVAAGVDPAVITPPAKGPLETTIALMDPAVVALHVDYVANQMEVGAHDNGFNARFFDLNDAIADIVMETTIQGASTLTLSIIDPDWRLLNATDKHGNRFLDTDEGGWLLPIDVNFPITSDCWYRLVSCDVSTVLDGPNVTLTFEDRVVSKMREKHGPTQAFPGEFLSTYIERRVKEADAHARFVSKVDPPPASAIAQAKGDSSGGSGSPASAQHRNASPGRKNPQKDPGTTASEIAQAIANDASKLTGSVLSIFGLEPPSNAGHGAVP